MRRPDAPFESGLVQWLKVGRSTRVAIVRVPGIDPSRTFVYKQHYFKGWLHALASLVRRNQATRAWRAGGSLLLRELSTPQPLALIHKTVFGLPVVSYLLTDQAPGRSIVAYLDDVLPPLDARQRRRLVREMVAASANTLRLLHSRRATHRDLKSSNVLYSAEDAASPRLWLIDLDGVQTWRRVPWHRRMQNLTRFYVSFHFNRWITRTDRLRFLKTYLRGEFGDPSRWKAVWRAVARQTDEKIRRNARRGRGVV